MLNNEFVELFNPENSNLSQEDIDRAAELLFKMDVGSLEGRLIFQSLVGRILEYIKLNDESNLNWDGIISNIIEKTKEEGAFRLFEIKQLFKQHLLAGETNITAKRREQIEEIVPAEFLEFDTSTMPDEVESAAFLEQVGTYLLHEVDSRGQTLSESKRDGYYSLLKKRLEKYLGKYQDEDFNVKDDSYDSRGLVISKVGDLLFLYQGGGKESFSARVFHVGKNNEGELELSNLFYIASDRFGLLNSEQVMPFEFGSGTAVGDSGDKKADILSSINPESNCKAFKKTLMDFCRRKPGVTLEDVQSSYEAVAQQYSSEPIPEHMRPTFSHFRSSIHEFKGTWNTPAPVEVSQPVVAPQAHRAPEASDVSQRSPATIFSRFLSKPKQAAAPQVSQPLQSSSGTQAPRASQVSRASLFSRNTPQLSQAAETKKVTYKTPALVSTFQELPQIPVAQRLITDASRYLLRDPHSRVPERDRQDFFNGFFKTHIIRALEGNLDKNFMLFSDELAASGANCEIVKMGKFLVVYYGMDDMVRQSHFENRVFEIKHNSAGQIDIQPLFYMASEFNAFLPASSVLPFSVQPINSVVRTELADDNPEREEACRAFNNQFVGNLTEALDSSLDQLHDLYEQLAQFYTSDDVPESVRPSFSSWRGGVNDFGADNWQQPSESPGPGCSIM